MCPPTRRHGTRYEPEAPHFLGAVAPPAGITVGFLRLDASTIKVASYQISPTVKPSGKGSEGSTDEGRTVPRLHTRTASQHRRETHAANGSWSAGLRPALRGSAKPAPMTPGPANAARARGRLGAPVSDRHRAGARNLHQ